MIMRGLYKLSRLVAIFVGAAGFLFGQVFSGVFSVAGMLGGLGGVAAGILAGLPSHRVPRPAVLAACIAGLLGAAMHVYDYYSRSHVPGNYYAWFLTGPFVVALIIIAFQAAKKPAHPSTTA